MSGPPRPERVQMRYEIAECATKMMDQAGIKYMGGEVWLYVPTDLFRSFRNAVTEYGRYCTRELPDGKDLQTQDSGMHKP